ncbi:MAG: hypothetical protein PVH87_06090 [Desulfobacteraceae bacterium]|jgi:hypothetical protein
MAKRYLLLLAAGLMITATGCATAYKAKPLPFKAPTAYDNMVQANGIQVGGQAFVDPATAKAAFGFDVRGAGMLPVQLVFDNQGRKSMEINPAQTFLEDNQGNLWPILTDKFAYERATKYAQTQQIFKEGAYKGFLGAAAGTIIGAAIGVVSGEDVARTAGEGAAIGAAAGSVLGGASAYASDDARSAIVRDLKDKSLENQAITPGNLAHGIIFFPGEAATARQLRLQLRERDTGEVHTLFLKF